MVNPCCGLVPLQIAAKIVSIIDAIGAMFGAFTSVVVLLGLIFFREDLEDELYRENANGTNYELKQFMDQPVGVQYGMLGFSILVCIFEIAVAVVLFQGARLRNTTRCLLWFRIHCVLLVFGIIFSAITVIIAEERILLSIACLIGLFYQGYSLWIVRAFIHQLNSIKFDDDDEQGEPLQEIRKS